MLETIITYQTTDGCIYAVTLRELRLITKSCPPVSVKRYYEENITIKNILITK
jgi:hypothetical protein